MEQTCKDLHETVIHQEEEIKELTLEISFLRQELEIQNHYFQELIDSLAESIEGNYFNDQY